jgi:peptidoglycan/LPS O-acetylase OafA/YrhL
MDDPATATSGQAQTTLVAQSPAVRFSSNGNGAGPSAGRTDSLEPEGRSAEAQEDLRSIVSRSHMPSLDGFRAVAAFSVIAFHGGFDTRTDGVTGFYVLSGFLITTLLMREWGRSQTVSLRNFYLRRTLRIFPAYYCFILFSWATDYVRGVRWTTGLLASAVGYMVNYYNAVLGHPHTSIAHAWSLAIEEQFYLLWPLIFIALARRGMRVAQSLLVGLILGSVAWRIFLYLAADVGKAHFYNAFDSRFDNLLIGCLLALLAQQDWFQPVARKLAARAWYPLVTIGGLFVVQQAFEATMARYLLSFTLYSALIAVLLVQLMLVSRSAAWRWLDSTPMRYLGAISYPTYLYHVKALGLVGIFLPGESLTRLLLGTLITYGMASFSYHCIEQPFLRLKNSRKPVPAPRRPEMSQARSNP